jgi:hypothetical protein
VVAVAASLAAAGLDHISLYWLSGSPGVTRASMEEALVMTRHCSIVEFRGVHDCGLAAPQLGGGADVLLRMGGDDPGGGAHGPVALGVAGAQAAVFGGAALGCCGGGSPCQAAFRVAPRAGSRGDSAV